MTVELNGVRHLCDHPNQIPWGGWDENGEPRGPMFKNPAVELEATHRRWDALSNALNHKPPKLPLALAAWLAAPAFAAGLLLGAAIVDRQGNGNERVGFKTGCEEDEAALPMQGYVDGLRWECVHREAVGDQVVIYRDEP